MELPLFPLNTVLCPGIALPLHIFEERYRALVRHCLETESPFGIVLIKEGREVGSAAISFSTIGTVAEIRDAGSYEDGRYDLLVVGTRRFTIERIISGRRPYLVAEVEVLGETVGEEATAKRLAQTATRRFVTYLELLQPRPGETADEIDVRVEVETAVLEPEAEQGGEPDPDPESSPGSQPPSSRHVVIPDDPTVLSYLLAGILQVELPRRQALLEMSTTEQRLRSVLALIERETFLLRRRLRAFTPDAKVYGHRRS